MKGPPAALLLPMVLMVICPPGPPAAEPAAEITPVLLSVMPPAPVFVIVIMPPMPPAGPASAVILPATPLVVAPEPMAKVAQQLLARLIRPPLPLPTPEALRSPLTKRLPPADDEPHCRQMFPPLPFLPAGATIR